MYSRQEYHIGDAMSFLGNCTRWHPCQDVAQSFHCIVTILSLASVGRHINSLQINCFSLKCPIFSIYWSLPEPIFSMMVVKWWYFSTSSTPSTFTSQFSVFYYKHEPSLLPLYLSSCYHYELMDSYFSSMAYNSLLFLIILVPKLFYVWTVGTLSISGSCVLAICAHYFLEHFLTFFFKNIYLFGCVGS